MNSQTSRRDFLESSRLRISELTRSQPLELRYVKALFLQKQYRRCIAACRDLLKTTAADTEANPIRQIFIKFYLALAHDEVARAMHNYSQAKTLAFNQADELYSEALQSLPTARDCMEVLEGAPEGDQHGSAEEIEEPTPRLLSSSTFSTSTSHPALSGIRSPPHATHIRNNSAGTSSPPMNSPGATSSDMDELESHDSFREIMTPNRIPKLQRDYSSMSLIRDPHPQMSEGLMRPIRRGSPPTQYRVPPKLPYSGTVHQQSKLPRLDTTSLSGSPVRRQLRSPSEQVSPIDSPVSPLGSAFGRDFESDESTISPISPATPCVGDDDGMLGPDHYIGDLDRITAAQKSIMDLDRHLQGVRSQLESHVKLLRDAKQQTVNVQTERSAARKAPTKSGQLASFLDASGTRAARLQQAHSYWSFTPEDVKLLEKQKRIEDGRRRGWMRARFDATRYSGLAEKAMAEL